MSVLRGAPARSLAALAAALAAACGADGARPPCEPAALTRALERAGAGTRVELGACAVTGSFLVPAGVELAGRGRGSSTLRGTGDAPVVRLAPGASLTGTRVEVPGNVGVSIAGDGSFALDALEIVVERGIGIGVAGARAVAVRGVRLTGAVVPERVLEIGTPADPAETSTYGLLAFEVDGPGETDGLSLRGVEARGFATAAIAIVTSRLTWQRAEAGPGATLDVLEGNRGHGLALYGSRARIEGLRACGTLSAPGLPGITLASVDGGELSTEGVEICDGDGFGVFHDGGSGVHSALQVHGMEQAAVWAQSDAALGLLGGSVLQDDGVAGVVAVDAGAVSIRETRIERIREKSIPTSATGAERMGDGIHVVRTAGATAGTSLELEVRDTSVADGERVGLLLDGGGGPLPVALFSLGVRGSGEALGAIAQRIDALPATWDAEVAREGATAANDAAFAMLRRLLETTGIIMPPASPPALD